MPKNLDNIITFKMKGGYIMTLKEKLQFFVDNGMSLSYIAKIMKVDLTTLSKWLHNQKGLSTKNKEKLYYTLQNIASQFWQIME